VNSVKSNNVDGDEIIQKVLFVCTHNSARSQMAETFLNHLGEGRFVAESAGLEKGELNPVVVEAMAELGYDISNNQTNSVFEFFKEGRKYDLVIKVCDQSSAQQCPIFPGVKLSWNWDFRDPSSFTGSHEERLAQTRAVRDAMKTRIEEFLRVVIPG
jgi:arsenate reductase